LIRAGGVPTLHNNGCQHMRPFFIRSMKEKTKEIGGEGKVAVEEGAAQLSLLGKAFLEGTRIVGALKKCLNSNKNRQAQKRGGNTEKRRDENRLKREDRAGTRRNNARGEKAGIVEWEVS